ncbi:hypothetical protein M408DRAFT_300003 [Serendipita vermifera MAFF 305830]|uniref:Uncharacterized protein n=1 Tax=Serendipita vermifera MAFF 305830 TaxID=933852 RepID=A0A0C2WWU9_SERVB|nr:hypothetical protein M408DRAFT_300003 [Serendipita vermifera MAFF 305830]
MDVPRRGDERESYPLRWRFGCVATGGWAREWWAGYNQPGDRKGNRTRGDGVGQSEGSYLVEVVETRVTDPCSTRLA